MARYPASPRTSTTSAGMYCHVPLMADSCPEAFHEAWSRPAASVLPPVSTSHAEQVAEERCEANQHRPCQQGRVPARSGEALFGKCQREVDQRKRDGGDQRSDEQAVASHQPALHRAAPGVFFPDVGGRAAGDDCCGEIGADQRQPPRGRSLSRPGRSATARVSSGQARRTSSHQPNPMRKRRSPENKWRIAGHPPIRPVTVVGTAIRNVSSPMSAGVGSTPAMSKGKTPAR